MNRNYYSSNPRDGDPYGQINSRLKASPSEQKINFNTGTIAVLAGVLILGVGIGSAITSTTDGGQGNIASQQQLDMACLLYTSPSPRDSTLSRMPSSA